MISLSTRKIPVLLLSAVLVFSSCQTDKSDKDKEDPAPLPVAATEDCKRIKALYPDDGNSYDETIYGAGNKISRINSYNGNSILLEYKTYAYNQQGKASEENYHSANGSITGKQTYTYNLTNQLTRIDFQGNSTQAYYPAPGHIILHYNAAGQRVKADFYNPGNSAAPAYFFNYTYSTNSVTGMKYQHAAQTTPVDIWEINFDTKKSLNSALGYLNGLVPDAEKHNVVEIKRTDTSYSPFHTTYSYSYNTEGYPVQASVFQDSGWGPYAIHYEYTCR